jgi:3D (Asp-Asp-Asp) domain-containing protein
MSRYGRFAGLAAAILLTVFFTVNTGRQVRASASEPVEALEALVVSSPQVPVAAGGEAPGTDDPPGYAYWKTVMARVTAYDPSERCCAPFADGRTSIGDNAWRMDGVAADPGVLPYRTLVWVPGVGWREVDDTGSAMKASWRRERTVHIDVRMPYFYQARRWGVRQLPIRLYRRLAEVR